LALIKCAECGNEMSDKAAACPRCGAPNAPTVTTGAAPTAPPPPSTPVQAAPIQALPVPMVAKAPKPFFTVGRVLAWLFILGGGWLAFRMLTGSSLAGAIQGPETIVNESLQLKEGAAMSYSFILPSSRRVDVKVNAAPKNVNVMLMTDEQWLKYEKVHGSLWGGEFMYTRALSRQDILSWEGSDVLPAGRWRVVIERPKEAILFGHPSDVSVTIVAR
jgi:hypothetical protein